MKYTFESSTHETIAPKGSKPCIGYELLDNEGKNDPYVEVAYSPDGHFSISEIKFPSQETKSARKKTIGARTLETAVAFEKSVA